MNRESPTPESALPTPAFAWIILACLGLIDLVRGVLHTFFVHHSAVDIAGMDLAHSGQDQLLLLGAFGISNFLTGFLYLLVAFKARQIVPTILALIPLSYVLGFVAFRLNAITPAAAFPGRTFMLAYCGVCVVTIVAGVIVRRSSATRRQSAALAGDTVSNAFCPSAKQSH